MKSKNFVRGTAVLALLTSAVALADHRGGGNHGNWNNNNNYNHGNQGSSDNSWAIGAAAVGGIALVTGALILSDGSCSAGAENVAQIDTQIDQLMATPEFANAAAMRAKVAEIRAIADPSARATAYMGLAGIASPQQFAALLGDDGLRQKYVVEMAANNQLTAAQANAVLEAVETGLLGDLR